MLCTVVSCSKCMLLTLFGFTAFVVLFSVVTLALGTLKASSTLHCQLLHNVLQCSMSFFDTTPVGRIINRFGKDVDVLDNSIPVSIRAWINCLFSVILSFFSFAMGSVFSFSDIYLACFIHLNFFVAF